MTYAVSYMVVYTEIVEAESFEEAAEIVANDCPYDIDGSAWVTCKETGEEAEVWEIEDKTKNKGD